MFREDGELLPAKLSHCLLAVLVSLYCSDEFHESSSTAAENAARRGSPRSTTRQDAVWESGPGAKPIQAKGVLRKALSDCGFPHSVLNIPDHGGKVCENAVALGLNAILTLMSEGRAIEIFARE